MATNDECTIVFKNANIIDGTGCEPVYGGTVVVRDDRISEVMEGSPGVVPATAEVIDCRGRFLLPGLIDAHVHVICVEADVGTMMRRNYTSALTIRALGMMEQALNQGFTTVRDCGGADAGFRVAVEQGWAVGPRMSVAGRHLSMTGGHGDDRWPTELFQPVESPNGYEGLVVDGVDACRKAAREQLRQGVDFIKVMAGGGCISPSDSIEAAQYSLDELKAIVWEAQSAGTYVSAHCYSDRSILNSLAAGIRSIEHGNLMTESVAAEIKAQGAILVPTLAAYEVGSRMGEELGIPPEMVQKIREAREKSEAALGLAHQAGCTIASGSDLLGPAQLFRGEELALKARVLGPMGAIVATTRTNAELLGRQAELGTIESGKLADLILVEGDPLEDISVFTACEQNVSLVMQGGRIHKNQ